MIMLVPSEEFQRERKNRETRSYIVAKSNDLIQRSRYQLSLEEQKIICYIISKIKPTDTEFQLYSIDIKDFLEICGSDKYNGGNTTMIKAMIKGLADKSIWIRLNDGRETIVRWIERPYIDEGSGIIQIKLDELMKPYLLSLKKNYTQFELIYVLGMGSKYSPRLYEILKSVIYKTHFVEYDLDKLKTLLDCKNYVRFPDLRRKVLDPATLEISNCTDITVKWEAIRAGRSVEKVRFAIEVKTEITDRIKIYSKIMDKIDEKANENNPKADFNDMSKE
jgi:plasmid replication initiation protein